jgi:hypothetical protein
MALESYLNTKKGKITWKRKDITTWKRLVQTPEITVWLSLYL